MYFLKKIHEIWEKFCKRIRKEFNSELEYSEKCLKQNRTAKKSKQISAIIKYQRNLLIVFAYQ